MPGSLIQPETRCSSRNMPVSIAILGGIGFFLSACLSMTVSETCFYGVLVTTPLCHIMGEVAVRVSAVLNPDRPSGNSLYFSIAWSLTLNCLLVAFDRADQPASFIGAFMIAFSYTVVVNVGIMYVRNIYCRGPDYEHASVALAMSTADIVAGLLAKVPAVHLEKEQLAEVLPASASTCVICLDDIADSPACVLLAPRPMGAGSRCFCRSGVLVLPCRHAFHYGCLARWMHHDHQRCPTCRRPLGPPAKWRLLLPPAEDAARAPGPSACPGRAAQPGAAPAAVDSDAAAEAARAGGEPCAEGDAEVCLHV